MAVTLHDIEIQRAVRRAEDARIRAEHRLRCALANRDRLAGELRDAEHELTLANRNVQKYRGTE